MYIGDHTSKDLEAVKSYHNTTIFLFIGSEYEDDESVELNEEGGEAADGPPPLKSEDHCHALVYHSVNADDQDIVENFVSGLENR